MSAMEIVINERENDHNSIDENTPSGCSAAGKNITTNTRKRKHKARILIVSLALPKLKREVRRGSPRMRFRAIHPIAMIYDDTRLTG